VEFEWDPAKAAANLGKHGIDFEDVPWLFEAPVLVERSDRGGEPRWKAVGELQGIGVAVAFTGRGPAMRIISARRARTHERRAYRAAYPVGAAAGTD
jgi:uncharacterized DUF497 family protein